MKLGTEFGYYAHPSKSLLIAKGKHLETAKTMFIIQK